jgi:hypothetical protein
MFRCGVEMLDSSNTLLSLAVSSFLPKGGAHFRLMADGFIALVSRFPKLERIFGKRGQVR